MHRNDQIDTKMRYSLHASSPIIYISIIYRYFLYKTNLELSCSYYAIHSVTKVVNLSFNIHIKNLSNDYVDYFDYFQYQMEIPFFGIVIISTKFNSISGLDRFAHQSLVGTGMYIHNSYNNLLFCKIFQFSMVKFLVQQLTKK